MDGILIIHTCPLQKRFRRKRIPDNGKELQFQTDMGGKEMENPQSDV